MPKLKIRCPKKDCYGLGDYIKSWTMPQKKQKKDGEHRSMTATGKVIKVNLYHCQSCNRNFRKFEVLKAVKDGEN